jgi:Zn-dependent membrane protease YugP
MFYFDPTYMFWVLIPTLLLGGIAQWRVKSAFSKWVRVRNSRGLSGVETARLLMQYRHLEGLKVDRISGQLTDHYDPRDKTIRLSESSTGNSVAAMAIVAHELGHAEQDLTGSTMLNLRSALVPVANIGSRLAWILILAGLFFGLTGLAWLGVIFFAIAVLFTVVTLPVEFDASKRAKRNLAEMGLVSPEEQKGVNEVLNAAALTYVAAALTAVLQLLYWVSIVSGRRS